MDAALTPVLYWIRWEKRRFVFVANLMRQDGIDFLRLAPEIGIITETTHYPLNQAIADLRAGRLEAPQFLCPECGQSRFAYWDMLFASR